MARLLIVEDDPVIGGNVCDFLIGRGHACDWAPDGFVAMALAAREPPEAVVLDLNLPRLDGLTAQGSGDVRQRTGDTWQSTGDALDGFVSLADHSETARLAEALHAYRDRLDQALLRERAYSAAASHVRPPLMRAGSSLDLLQAGEFAPRERELAARVQESLDEIAMLTAALLRVARGRTGDAANERRSADRVALHELLPRIVDDLRHLTRGKALEIVVDRLEPCVVEAPMHLVQAAVGNLIRNAIENSDRGEIHVSLDADTTVTIRDPGHGMPPEEISRIFAQIARGGGRDAGGIGVDLLGRICEHLGWRLSIDSVPGQGTVGRLQLVQCPTAS